MFRHGFRTSLRPTSKRTILMSSSPVGNEAQQVVIKRNLNGYRQCVALPGRKLYQRMYPTVFVYPDGSTVTARYPIPLSIIKLPCLREELEDPIAQKAWDMRRRPKEKMYAFKDTSSVTFNRGEYLDMFKKFKAPNSRLDPESGTQEVSSVAPPVEAKPEPAAETKQTNGSNGTTNGSPPKKRGRPKKTAPESKDVENGKNIFD